MSFSIRDEERSKVVLRIAKPHSSIAILKTLFGKDLPSNHIWFIQCNSEYNTDYHGYIGISNSNATQWIFLNYRPIHCPFILKLIKVAFKEELNLSFDQKSNAKEIHDENIFVLLFLTFPENKFLFITENGKRHVVFYDTQQILNNIKNCVFKCLSKDFTSSATPYSCKTHLLKQIYLKSEKSVFNNNINERNKKSTSLIRESEIVRIDFKRKKITSTIVTNYSMHETCSDVDKRQRIFTSRAITNDSAESNKTNNSHNYYNCNNNDSANIISPLSEWSNWTYCTNIKEHCSVRNMCNTSKSAQQIFKCIRQFDFLPRKLYNFLQYRHIKLTDVKRFNSPNSAFSCK